MALRARTGSFPPETETVTVAYSAKVERLRFRIFEILKICVGNLSLVLAPLHRLPYLDDALRRGVGKRPEENGIDDGENRGAGPDAHRQRRDAGGSGAEVLEETP